MHSVLAWPGVYVCELGCGVGLGIGVKKNGSGAIAFNHVRVFRFA